MPRNHQAGVEPPAKRQKVDSKGGYRYTSADEIRKSLRAQDQESLVRALTALRNQLSVKPEERIAPQDERLLLAQHWMEIAPGAQDMFEAWEGSNPKQMSVSALFVSVLASLLELLSSHYTYHALGLPIVKTLLSSQWMRRLNSHLGGTNNELILVTLRLLSALSAFAGGRERKAVLDAFSWDTKSLSKLLFMRRKSKNDNQPDAVLRPDIRTLYVQFVLSFVNQDASTVVKSAFLEQHRDIFLSIFKGIVQDPYQLIHKTLEVCWTGVWSDPKIKRTLKITLFNESTILQLMKLYDRVGSESTEADLIPADLVHHFLLAICTRPGVGICFKDRGWYSRDSDGDEKTSHDDDVELGSQRNNKIYNKILANVLKTLKVNEDSRQQELALKIMSSCPELVAGYWHGAALTLEPRLSSKWIANIAFFGSVISLPIPSSSFLLSGSAIYQPSPPPLSTILENVMPSVNTKNNLSKGLQSPSPLVQHCTALALAKCLVKYTEVLRVFRKVEGFLEEEDEDGQWFKRRREFEREIRRRVPDFQVIIGFSQQKLASQPSGDSALATRLNLLAESAQRLLWLYHCCLPALVAEARFDVGKLLLGFEGTVSDEGAADPQFDFMIGLQTVKQLHILRLLKESDQFTWSGKPASSSTSYVHILLKAYNVSETPATRSAIASLLIKVLSDCILFQEDSEEVTLWLTSLPESKRGPDSESPDGAKLTDEGDSVIAFLDDCIQRCLKTPYRYLEDRDAWIEALSDASMSDENTGYPEETLCSPLLLTVVEQLGAKLGGQLLGPSDTLAIASFVRKLLLKLSSKLQNVAFLSSVADKLDQVLHRDLYPKLPNITTGIRREVRQLRRSLTFGLESLDTQPLVANVAVQEFLGHIEKLSIPPSRNARTQAAYELSDWLRLTDHALDPTETQRLASAVIRFHPEALKELSINLNPHQGSLWDVISLQPAISTSLSFDYLFTATFADKLEVERNRTVLVDSLFRSPTSPAAAEIIRAMCLISHRIAASEGREYVQQDLLLLSAAIMQRARTAFLPATLAVAKEFLFGSSTVFKALCFSQTLGTIVGNALEQLLANSLDRTSDDDRKLVSDFSTSYKTQLVASVQFNDTTLSTAAWIKYMEPDALFEILDSLVESISHHSEDRIRVVLEAILAALKTSKQLDHRAIGNRWKLLWTLRSHFSDLLPLEELIAYAASSYLPACHDGSPLDLSLVSSLADLSESAQARWSSKISAPLHMPNLLDLLQQKPWTKSTSRIASSLMYQPQVRAAFLQFLKSQHSGEVATSDLVVITRAYLDSAIQQGTGLDLEESHILSSHFSFLLSNLRTNVTAMAPTTRRSHVDCLFLTVQLVDLHRSELLASLKSHIKSASTDDIIPHFIILGKKLHRLLGGDEPGVGLSLVESALPWATRALSIGNELSDDTSQLIVDLAALVTWVPQIKIHLVEPLITVAVQHHLADVLVMKLVAVLLTHAQLKPVSVNRYLQSIVQSPQFFKICSLLGAHSAPRKQVVETLHVLFNLHPTNTCQPSHIDPLIYIYNGSTSICDRQLLSIFQLFERQRKSSVASVFGRWSATSGQTSTTALEALQSLDPIRILRTCLSFPMQRSLTQLPHEALGHDATDLYDPVFVLSLVGIVFTDSSPSTALTWVEVFRTNVVSLMVRTLSAKSDDLRTISLSHLATLWKHLQLADMQERPQVLYILGQLKNTLALSAIDAVPRLPSYSTLIILHALRGIFYPSNFIYPLTARFLLQRPELDTTDVPMLYNMLYNSDDDWRKERVWIIRFLSDGMMSTSDWRVLKRRHSWELLSSLFQSSVTDRSLRNGVLEVLANITCNQQATMSLVLKSSLLTWIEIQLMSLVDSERTAWAKILENIIVIAPTTKLESVTDGEWRFTLCRCLALLVRGIQDPIITLISIVPVTLRLSQLPGLWIPQLALIAEELVHSLLRSEKRINVIESYHKHPQATCSSTWPPYHAAVVHDSHHPESLLRVWGESVESLWQVLMICENRTAAWDVVTSRLLIWRAIVGEEGSEIGEWARREVVRNIGRN